MLAAPGAAPAQPGKRYRIGYLANDPDPRASSPTFRALMRGLQELGWIEGKNIEMRLAASRGRLELFPQLAREMVQDKVDIIVTGGSAATRAAQAATDTIPIVFASAADPVSQKLVASLARPGRNVTGLALVVQDLAPKRLQLLTDMLPRAKRFTRLFHADSITAVQGAIRNEEDSAARRLGVTLKHVAVRDLAAVEAALGAAARSGADAILLTGAGLFVANRESIAKLALHHRLPTMCSDGRFADAGALASYGENFPLRYRRVAVFVDKILRGAKPLNIPVEQSAVFELVVNLGTAQSLGVTVPEPILLQADRVIG